MVAKNKADVLLYVEDEMLIQSATIPILEDAGFEVLTAHNGAEALNIIATESGSIDGLVTDVNLGLGPNGWNVARCARERMAQMPVVYASSVGEDEWMARGVPLSQLVKKPYKASRIAGAMSKLIVDARLLVHRGAF
jgi:DNA-binding response OmpR family regulator